VEVNKLTKQSSTT